MVISPSYQLASSLPDPGSDHVRLGLLIPLEEPNVVTLIPIRKKF